jgi:hypothetical protein
MDDTAMADDIAVAIEEGDGEIGFLAPVALGDLEGGLGERQHGDHADRAPGQRFAREFDRDALPALDAETAEKDGDLFPDIKKAEAGGPERRIEPGIEPQEEVALEALVFQVFAVVGHLEIPGNAGQTRRLGINAAASIHVC